MARTTTSQRRTVGRVMHEAKHGELQSGPGGKGGKVKSRKQAIAIALHEAGESKYDSPATRRRNASRSRSKEARGRTGQQEKEGKSHLGARGKRESFAAMRRQAPAATGKHMTPSARSRTKTASTRTKAAATRKKSTTGRARKT